MRTKLMSRRLLGALVAGGLSVAALAAAQSHGETFTATAAVKSPDAAASAEIKFQVDRYLADADRQRILDLAKANDTAALRSALTKMDDIGYIEIANRRTPIKYAYVTPSGAGRLVTLITAQPLFFLGGAAPDAKSRTGYDLGLALLMLDAHDIGSGELVPAAQVGVNESGAIVTKDYGGETIRLTDVARSK